MEIREHALRAADEVATALGLSFGPEQRGSVAGIIERELLNTVLEVRNRAASAALKHSTTEKDLAHQISEDIHRSNQLLVTNLESLR